MPAALIGRILLPVLLVVGGGAAFVASSSSSSSPVVRAWVDDPLHGSTIAEGEYPVQVHASGASITSIELLVDGQVIGETIDLDRTGHLAHGIVPWPAEVGEHELVARAHDGDATADGAPARVLVSDAPPEPTDTSSTTPADPTSTTVVDGSTTAPSDTTTTTATTTTTTAPLPAPPQIARLFHTPDGGDTTTEITITAAATAPDLGGVTITIEARNGQGGWNELVACPVGTSPCSVTRTFQEGEWTYRATAVDADGQAVTAGDTDQTRFFIDL